MRPETLALTSELAASLRSVPDPRSVPVRYSSLKMFALSPAHYLSRLTDPDDKDTLARRIGRGTHAMVFGTPWTVYPGKVRNGRVWDEFRAAHEGEEILNQREYEQSRRMADALLGNELARTFLLGDGAKVEQSIDWSFLGRACRSRPDSYRPEAIVDLKTTRLLPPARFIRSATTLGYHGQLAFYQDAIRSAGIGTADEAYIVTVESVPPYSVTVMHLTPRALEYGRRMWRVWFEELLNCESSGQWPGYAQEPIEFDVDPSLDEMFGEGDEPDDPEWVGGEPEGDDV